MRIFPSCRGGALLCFWLSLASAVCLCYGDEKKTVEVVGIGECADCAQNNFEPKQAFSGLHVTIDCKTPDGQFKTRGSGELDEEGKFKVSLPHELVKEGKLNEECYAQLHSSSAEPCPDHDGLESSKIVSKTIKTDDKHTFGLPGKLKFSPVTCASAFFWHHFRKNHPFFSPKTPEPQKPLPPPAPKKELPSPVPKKEPNPPKAKAPKKEFPPSVPKKNPCPPKIEKPLPPPVPVITKPLPPPVPVYKPKHPFFKHPFFKHLPPFPKFPQHPLFPKLPPFPGIYHKYFGHPKFGKVSVTQHP
ncbi:Proline-rich protein [Parasponia andersonii]|uniref:Proline-rich protein n=1 Tax=Parasponia andersonii TaxID=3476 RepID=A0A2P5C253_PARAD|nr:Proline-rich protein [Parasponia andersonii]